MDLLDLVRIALRRWYVAVPAAIVVVVGSFVARASVELTYQSTGSLLLFAPRESVVSKNRLLGFNSLAIPAAVSARVVGDAATREKLEALGASEDFEVGLDPNNPAPLVIAVATGGRKQAPRTVDLVLKEVNADLQRRQEALGAPPETWITTEVVTPPSRPVPQSGARTRAFLAVLIVGAGAAALVTILFDRIADARVRRRAGSRTKNHGAVPDVVAPDRGATTSAEPFHSPLPVPMAPAGDLLPPGPRRHPRPRCGATSSPCCTLVGAGTGLPPGIPGARGTSVAGRCRSDLVSHAGSRCRARHERDGRRGVTVRVLVQRPAHRGAVPPHARCQPGPAPALGRRTPPAAYGGPRRRRGLLRVGRPPVAPPSVPNRRRY